MPQRAAIIGMGPRFQKAVRRLSTRDDESRLAAFVRSGATLAAGRRMAFSPLRERRRGDVGRAR
jgi:hypothetical protein